MSPSSSCRRAGVNYLCRLTITDAFSPIAPRLNINLQIDAIIAVTA
ncbi:MAG TPA: hypothetical protein VK157_00215 [Phycisphaerales bacterium]|nr:hypothetical protein [Phycisphaerales bacterium]